MAGIALRRWHRTPCRRMSWTWCVGTCKVPCPWGFHPRDRPPSPSEKTPRSIRDASRRTRSWRLFWNTARTRTNERGPIRQHGATCTGPHDPATNYSSQPMVAKIFMSES